MRQPKQPKPPQIGQIIAAEREIAHAVQHDGEILKHLLEETKTHNRLLHEIAHLLRALLDRPVTLTLTLDSEFTMVGDTAVATVVETDAQGKIVTLVPANISFSVADTSIATVSSNGDGTATITAVGEGTTTLTATDSAYTLTGSASITVTGSPSGGPGKPTTLTVTVGDFSAPAAAANQPLE